MTGRWGSTRYAKVLAELEAAGIELSVMDDVRRLYLLLARFKGLPITERFRPSSRQARRAISIYQQTGRLADLSKPVSISLEAAHTPEDVLALGSQTNREGNIVRLYLAQQGKCHYCRREMLLSTKDCRKPLYATIDHVVPRCQGGKKNPENVVAACGDCNSRKGHMAYHLFMAMVGGAA